MPHSQVKRTHRREAIAAERKKARRKRVRDKRAKARRIEHGQRQR